MHIQRITLALVLFSTLMWANLSLGQNQFNSPNTESPGSQTQLTDQTIESSPTSQNQSLPPITPKSIFNNELRGNDTSANTKQEFDAQPLPPQPKSFRPKVAQGSFGDGERSESTRQPEQQNPLQQLSPSRITQNTPLDPQVIPPRNLQQQSQRSGLPTMDSRSEVFQKPHTGQAIPVVDNSNLRRSVMNAGTPNVLTDNTQVVPATYNDPLQNPISSAKSLIASFDVSSSNRSLPGVPVSLEDLMRTTPIRYRLAMVQQYWETYFDWATLTNRVAHSQWLDQIPNPRVPAEQNLLQTAKLMAKNDVMAAEIQLSKSQSKLQQLSRARTQDLLPLPLNQPLVTKYKTHYEWYQARNMIPAKLKGINEMLPRTHELLDLRAKTAQQADQVRTQFRNSFSTGQASVAELLESARVWQSAMQSFLATVISYNQAISDYALTITPPQKPLTQIVSMLVAKPKSVNEVAARNSVLERNTRPVNNLTPQSTQDRLNQQVNRGSTGFANQQPRQANNTIPGSNRGNTINPSNARTNKPNPTSLSPSFANQRNQLAPQKNGSSTDLPNQMKSPNNANTGNQFGSTQNKSGNTGPFNAKQTAPSTNPTNGNNGAFKGGGTFNGGGGGFKGSGGGNFGG